MSEAAGAQPSSADLHPKTGARFVFERRGEALCYDVMIYLPAGRSWGGALQWRDGRSVIADEPGAEAVDDALRWALAEAHKLARVLHREPKAKLSRWRVGPRPS
jgi:hypothetical protein